MVDLFAHLRDRSVASLEGVPPAFRDYLGHIRDTIDLLPGEQGNLVKCGLATLAPASNGMTRAELVRYTGWSWDGETIESFLRVATPFLITDASSPLNPSYRLFHPLFRDFLVERFFGSNAGEVAQQAPGVEDNSGTTIRTRDAQPDGSDNQAAAPALPSTAPHGPTEARHLLAIGVDEYVDQSINKLGFCGDDVAALAAKLSSHNYAVDVLHDQQAAQHGVRVQLLELRAVGKLARRDAPLDLAHQADAVLLRRLFDRAIDLALELAEDRPHALPRPGQLRLLGHRYGLPYRRLKKAM
jgi:hypothetical protein